MNLNFEYGHGFMKAELPDNTDIFIPGGDGCGSSSYTGGTPCRENPVFYQESYRNGAYKQAG